jgi:hypothetical protein
LESIAWNTAIDKDAGKLANRVAVLAVGFSKYPDRNAWATATVPFVILLIKIRQIHSTTSGKCSGEAPNRSI